MKTNVIVIGILFLCLAILQLIGGVFVIAGGGMAAAAIEEDVAKTAELQASRVAEFAAEQLQTLPETADADAVASSVDVDKLTGQAEAGMVEMGGLFSKLSLIHISEPTRPY